MSVNPPLGVCGNLSSQVLSSASETHPQPLGRCHQEGPRKGSRCPGWGGVVRVAGREQGSPPESRPRVGFCLGVHRQGDPRQIT